MGAPVMTCGSAPKSKANSQCKHAATSKSILTAGLVANTKWTFVLARTQTVTATPSPSLPTLNVSPTKPSRQTQRAR